MIEVEGIWYPDGEVHLPEHMARRRRLVGGRPTYQYHKLEAALAHVRRWRSAVDVGAHVGLWSMHLARRFRFVHAFEPVAAHRACFRLNVPAANVVLHGLALGAETGRVALAPAQPGHSGSTRVVPEVSGQVPLARLDDWELESLDFLKLDCEGYELFALQGAEETLRRCRPVVIVEQKPGRAERYGLAETQAVDYLQGLGAKFRQAIAGDYILSW